MAQNMFGPKTHSIYRWRHMKSYNSEQGIMAENSQKIATIYEDSKQDLGLQTAIPVMLAEHETAIGKIVYDEQSDTLQGFCGLETENPNDHQCVEDFSVYIGNNADAYDRLVNAFKQCKLANFARLILINPFVHSRPKIPVLIMPTCNRFSHELVCSQWC